MTDVSAQVDTTPGTSGTFNVDNVPVGTGRTLTLQGFSEAGGAGTVLFSGTQTNISVASGVNAAVEVVLTPGTGGTTTTTGGAFTAAMP